MIFIKAQNLISKDDVKLIEDSKALPENIWPKIEEAIVDFLKPSLDVLIQNYIKPEFRIIKASKRFKSDLGNDDELFNFDGEVVARNYCAFTPLSAKVYFNFPLQEHQVLIGPGDLVIYPASFLYPYETKIECDGELVELMYLFNKGGVEETEKELARTRSY